MIRSFVLGNGNSRKNIDLQMLKQSGKVYGCNALYREYTPDYLVAVDQKMIIEIQESKYQLLNEVWTNASKDVRYDFGFKYFNPRLGWSSGPSALKLASTHNPDEIYILGFDFSGIDGKFNNIYADTPNYNSANDSQTYWGNWQNQTELVIKTNPHIKFYRVIDENFYDTGWKYSNFKHISKEEFLKHININFKKQ